MTPYFTPVFNETGDSIVYQNVYIEYYGDTGGVMQIRSDEPAASRSGAIQFPGRHNLVPIRWAVDSPLTRTIDFDYLV